MKVRITDIQRFCMHDGPGIRTTVFMKGCPLKCIWCHNPETRSAEQEVLYTESRCIGCGRCKEGDILQCPTGAREYAMKEAETSEIMEQVLKDVPFYGEKGGITLSGGEPTFQWEAAKDLLVRARSGKISAAVETCGMFSQKVADELPGLADYILFDVKDTDPERLYRNTGADLKKIVGNLKKIDTNEKFFGTIIIRAIMIPSVNMNREHYEKLAALYGELKKAESIELIPYHPFGNSKYRRLGIEAEFEDRRPLKEELLEACGAIASMGAKVKISGTFYRES